MKNIFNSLFLFVLFICSSFCQQGGWMQLTTSAPPPARYQHSAIYDSASNTMLIFGGLDGTINELLNDLWSYSIPANSWSQLIPSILPPARQGHIGIYIFSSNSMLIFGGQGSGNALLNDLWSYSISSNTWSQVNVSNSPPVRYLHCGVYASSSNSMLIFGGDSTSSFLNDLWSYSISSNTWTQLNVSNPPPIRYGHSGVYASASNSMLIFGGEGNSGYLNDLWSYNVSSNTWSQVNVSSSPSARWEQSAVYDLASNTMLIFGGGGTGLFNDLWSYSISSNAWTQLTPSNPPPIRYGHSGIYVNSSNSMIIFAGQGSGFLNDLWSYSSQTSEGEIVQLSFFVIFCLLLLI